MNHWELLTRTALSDTKGIFSPHWEIIIKIPVFELREAVALSINLDPIYADFGWILAVCMCENEESPFDESDVNEFELSTGCKVLANRLGENISLFKLFIDRYIEATGNIFPAGSLPVFEKTGKEQNYKVRLTEFAIWAQSNGWNIPKNFPQTSNSQIKQGRRKQQIEIIKNTIQKLCFDPLSIPDNGKAKIKEICLNQQHVFTDSGFEHAWKAGLKASFFRLANHNRYSSNN